MTAQARPASTAQGKRTAFTLVEMLVVMGIIVILISAATAAVNGMKSTQDVSKAVYDLASLLGQARSYAMGNNTYVYVGLEEVDANQASSDTPQLTGTGHTGRLAVAVVAVRDGTRGYDPSVLSTDGAGWTAYYPTWSANVVPVGKLQSFSGVHLVDLGAPPTSGSSGMSRPTLVPDPGSSVRYSVGDPACLSATPFVWPAEASLTQGQYTFTKVIQFDSQGVARIQTSQNGTSVTSRIEIGLQQSHGTMFAALPQPAATGAIAAIQIDGMTGAVHIYRP